MVVEEVSAAPGPRRLIDIPEVTRLTTLKKSAIYELMSRGELRPVKLGAKTVFVEGEVCEWIERQIAHSRQVAA